MKIRRWKNTIYLSIVQILINCLIFYAWLINVASIFDEKCFNIHDLNMIYLSYSLMFI